MGILTNVRGQLSINYKYNIAHTISVINCATKSAQYDCSYFNIK